MMQFVVIFGLVLAGMFGVGVAYREGRAAANVSCNNDKIDSAHKALSAQLEDEKKARAAAESRATERERDLEEQRAASDKLETENAALRSAATDKGDIVFDAGDNWLRLRKRRSGTSGSSAGRR
jgi:biopolymer transport protein ExbB/TolQ